ncbi:hypothetical protein FUAX_34980 [Fulvitalea axinellae]|uniref:Lipoprotein n=1 Tax=Fulvitalea axinellae TaxID=1182444 RepID=A0AAU9DD19_9BACT|nr:hypothetical protein FUAX_34980 [Fulvitalea axinellae]
MNKLRVFFVVITLFGCGPSDKGGNEESKAVEIKRDVAPEPDRELSIKPKIMERDSKNGKPDTVVVGAELVPAFDSLMSLFLEYDLSRSGYDTLSIFNLKGEDTAIWKKETRLLENYEGEYSDPHTAYFLFGKDTVAGGLKGCDEEYYLFLDSSLVKVESLFGDCVESGSYELAISFRDVNGKRWIYRKVFHDVWDQAEFERGLESSVSEHLVRYESDSIGIYLTKNRIVYNEEMADTVKYSRERIEGASFNKPPNNLKESWFGRVSR